ncbi:hypothetical protein [Candidatus Vidania fulgoroideorum]
MIREKIEKIRIYGKKIVILGKRKIIDREKPYRIKFGIDTSNRNIHIGHLLCLLIIRKIAKEIRNVEIVVIIGDYTVNMVRNIRKYKIRRYANSIRSLVNQVLFSKKWKVLFFENSTWFTKLEFKEIFNIKINKLTKSRKEKTKIGQLLYPYFQNYDNIIIKPDIELGGMDQIYNFSFYNKVIGISKILFILVPLIKTIRNEKMSKSKKNCIYIHNNYKKMFWDIIRFRDKDIGEYLKIFSWFNNFKKIKFRGSVDINVSNKLNLFIILSRIIFKKNNINYVSLFLKKKLQLQRIIKIKKGDIKDLKSILKEIGIVRYTSDFKQLIKRKLILVNGKQLNIRDNIKNKEINNIEIGKRTKVVVLEE